MWRCVAACAAGNLGNAAGRFPHSLIARSKLVTDLTEQCAVIGDLHHALAAGGRSEPESPLADTSHTTLFRNLMNAVIASDHAALATSFAVLAY
jgi:hypothetical protein